MPNTAEVSISERIRKRMEALGLADVEVAAACGVSEQTVRNWKVNADKMWATNLRPLARALKCSVPYLLGLTDKTGRSA